MCDPVSHARRFLHTVHCTVKFIDCIARVDILPGEHT